VAGRGQLPGAGCPVLWAQSPSGRRQLADHLDDCEYEPEQVLGWAVGDPGWPGARWRFTLAAEPGGTRLTQWMQIGPAPSGVSMAIEARPDKESRILHRRLAEHQANMTATLTGIKELAEARSGC
jgi:hypothetical protein